MDQEGEAIPSRAYTLNVFHSIMGFLSRNPTELDKMVAELTQVIKVLGCSSDVVQLSFEFYRILHPSSTNCLLRQLFTEGVISENVTSQKCLGPFMSQLLFHTVTEGSVHCAEYGGMVWLDRFSTKDAKGKPVPSPIEYLDNMSPTQASPIPVTTLLQFKMLDDKQRNVLTLDFRKLVSHAGHTFHSRLAVAFFIFLEFYKKENSQGSRCYGQEVCVWIETLIKLILSITAHLQCTSQYGTPFVKQAPLHHVLCGLIMSTNALEFIASDVCFSSNILGGLEKLVNCSSGFTEKWLNALVFEVRSKVELGV